MEIGAIMQHLRDPAGIPAHPLLFQGLMVFTWTLHIAFVHLTLGAGGIAIWGYSQSENEWLRLAAAMTKVAKISVSLLIVLGVAPLLFTQVLYDPQWYVSNLLSSRWVIAFIFLLIIAYCLWFVVYFATYHGTPNKYVMYSGLVALFIFLVNGLIMHVLAYQAILPEHWLEWYMPGGIVDNTGSSLHAISWPRYLFIISLSAPLAGLFLIAYTHYFAVRADYPPDYLEFVRGLAKKIAPPGFAIALILFFAWQMIVPFTHPIAWLLGLSLLIMALWTRTNSFTDSGYWSLLGGVGVLALLSLWRELIRVNLLANFGYTIDSYPVNLDIPSTVLFFTTLITVGGSVGGYYLSLLYRAGRISGKYTTEEPIARLGSSAIAVLVIWIAIFFAYGITIWLSNNFLKN